MQLAGAVAGRPGDVGHRQPTVEQRPDGRTEPVGHPGPRPRRQRPTGSGGHPLGQLASSSVAPDLVERQRPVVELVCGDTEQARTTTGVQPHPVHGYRSVVGVHACRRVRSGDQQPLAVEEEIKAAVGQDPLLARDTGVVPDLDAGRDRALVVRHTSTVRRGADSPSVYGAPSAAYPGLITSSINASRSSNGRNDDFTALIVNHRRSASP